MKNAVIRYEAKKRHVYLWQIAERLNISDSSFSRKLRHELPKDEQKRIIAIIHEIEKEG